MKKENIERAYILKSKIQRLQDFLRIKKIVGVFWTSLKPSENIS